MLCPLCETPFTGSAGVPAALYEQWGLDDAQRAAIDRREAVCRCAKLNLRGAALVHAVRRGFYLNGRLVLVNTIVRADAGMLFRDMNVQTHQHPAIDLCALPFPNASLALLAHSDTLEHVFDIAGALEEAARVLVRGGLLAFTVPMVPGRPSRHRAGLPQSYHGPDLVHWEFGDDLLNLVAQKGFAVSADLSVGLVLADRVTFVDAGPLTD